MGRWLLQSYIRLTSRHPSRPRPWALTPMVISYFLLPNDESRRPNSCTWCSLRTSIFHLRMRNFIDNIESKPLSTSSWVSSPHTWRYETVNFLRRIDDLMTEKTLGRKKNIVLQNATSVVREALVTFNLCYPPSGEYKARRQQRLRLFRLLH